MAPKRKSLSLETKFKILKAVDDNKKEVGHKRKLGAIAEEFGIKKCTLSTILKEREILESRVFSGSFSCSAKRFRSADKFAEIENHLLDWFKTCRTSGIAISDELVKTKAQSLLSRLSSMGETSNGGSEITMSWIQRWKRRHNITSKILCGESNDVSEEVSHQWVTKILPTLLQRFSPSDIFNGDETGLFWKLTPQRTLAFVGEKCYGGKHSKERITVLVAASMTGEKLPLLIIGKSAHPRPFRNQSVPLEYTSNSKAWMTSAIFEQHIRKLDRRMSATNRKILLVIDNCPSHPKLDFLRNITLVFLPPKTTSKTQPMDCGVIWSLKTHYRKQLMMELLIAHEDKNPFKIDLLRALHWLKTAWDCVKVETIVNCFHSAGFRDESISLYTNPFSNDSVGLENIFERVRAAFSIPDSLSTEVFTLIDDDIITNQPPIEDTTIMLPEVDTVVSENDDLSIDADEQIPSHSEILDMLYKIRLYLLKHAASANDFCNLDSLHSSVTNTALSSKKQMTIDNFVTRS